MKLCPTLPQHAQSTTHDLQKRCAILARQPTPGSSAITAVRTTTPVRSTPRVRWREEQLERTIAEELGRTRLESDAMRGLVRTAMEAAFADLGSQQRKQAQALTKRQSELKGMQEWLLNAFLNGTIEEAVFAARSEELKVELAKTDRHLEQVDRVDPSHGAAALAIFDWSQQAADEWLGSNKAGRREILDTVCLNRKPSDASLCLEMRTPFRELSERRSLQNSRGDRRLTFLNDSFGQVLFMRALAQRIDFPAGALLASGQM